MRSLQFQGYQNIVTQRELKPVGREGQPIEVATLANGQWATEKPVSADVVKMKNTQDGTSFFYRHITKHPRASYLSTRGAYLLTKDCLQFNILSEIDVVVFTKKNTNEIGSVQDEIQGIRLCDLQPQKIQEMVRQLKASPQGMQSIFELYTYVKLALDWDQHSENVLYDPTQNQVYSCDPEFAGEGYSYSRFPKVLALCIENQNIPEAIRLSLDSFLKNQLSHTERLAPYFSPKTLDRMFQTADKMIKNPAVNFQTDSPRWELDE